MWKKVLLLLLLVIVGVPAGGLAYLYLRKPAQAPPSAIRVAMTPERIARGKFLFQTISDCDGCHSERDFTRVGGPVVESGRGRGNILSALMNGLPGTVVAPNITPDPETGIGKWTDGEKIRAIREGVDRDGRALFPMMPYAGYRNMSDEDVESVVAYLNCLSPVKNPLPPTQLAFPVPLFIKSVPQPAGSVPPPVRSDKMKYGQYLVSLGGCVDCHTPTQKGQPIPGKELAGGQVFATNVGTVVSANITPDLETGIGKWSEEFFFKKFYDYREYAAGGAPKAAGPEAFTLMPWLAFSQLPPEDLGAIYAFLRTMKPVHNPVETHPGAPKPAAL
jgi:mono/diheme cytochrome c family protein